MRVVALFAPRREEYAPTNRQRAGPCLTTMQGPDPRASGSNAYRTPYSGFRGRRFNAPAAKYRARIADIPAARNRSVETGVAVGLPQRLVVMARCMRLNRLNLRAVVVATDRDAAVQMVLKLRKRMVRAVNNALLERDRAGNACGRRAADGERASPTPACEDTGPTRCPEGVDGYVTQF